LEIDSTPVAFRRQAHIFFKYIFSSASLFVWYLEFDRILGLW
jgi:hypothetical protein